MSYQYHTLPNGIRLLHRQTSAPVAHCGLLINAGSRDENKSEQGLAHYIEHGFFKGTLRRKAFHVLSHMENVGGEINAYTSKEETCIYGSFMAAYYERWCDIVSDITFRSSFPDKEMNREKEIIIDEINSYKDNPAEHILDDFDEMVFHDHPMGRNILGTPAHVRSFDRRTVLSFIESNYAPEEMVICSVGDIGFAKLVALAQKYFGDATSAGKGNKRTPPNQGDPRTTIVQKHNHQAHCVIGTRAYDLSHPGKTALVLLNNILGGPGLTSRLNMSVREKHGFCYHIESMYQAYSDSGIFGIYFGTDPAFVDKTLQLIHKELKRLKSDRLGSLQLSRAKKQLSGQVSISYESGLNEMLFAGKGTLHLNRPETLEEVNERIYTVSAPDLLEAANELFDQRTMSTLTYVPN